MATKRTIIVQGCPKVYDEDVAGGAITPGHVLMFSNGELVKNTDDAANVAALLALGREELGTDIDEDYATGDQVKVAHFGAGDRGLVIIPSGQNVSKGDYLTPDTAGRFTKTSVSATVRSCFATETVDNSAGPGDARIVVQFL